MAKYRLRFAWTVALALAVQAIVSFVHFEADSLVPRILYPLSYIPLAVFVALNWRHIGILLIGVGLILNFTAIVANGGLMPVSPENVVKAGREAKIEGLESGDYIPETRNVLLDKDDTRLEWLTDRFVWDSPGPFQIFSAGDIVIALGLLAALAEALWVMLGPVLRRRASVA